MTPARRSLVGVMVAWSRVNLPAHEAECSDGQPYGEARLSADHHVTFIPPRYASALWDISVKNLVYTEYVVATRHLSPQNDSR